MLFLWRKLEPAAPQPAVLPVPRAHAGPADIEAWAGDYGAKLAECRTDVAKTGDEEAPAVPELPKVGAWHGSRSFPPVLGGQRLACVSQH